MGFDPIGAVKGSIAGPAGMAMGGFGGGKGGGAPPDFSAASDKATRQSRPNQSTPFASSSWTEGPGGNWTQHVGLNGPLDSANQGMQNQFADAWGSPLDNGSNARQHAEDAIYQREASRLDPMWDKREQSNRTQLEQQGIDPNSEAGRGSMDTMGRSRNDAYSTALQDAIMGGGQEGQRQQSMDMFSRMAPLLGMQGLQGLSQMPSFQTGGNPLGASIAQGNYQMDSAKLNEQYWADLMNGLAGGAKAAAGGGK